MLLLLATWEEIWPTWQLLPMVKLLKNALQATFNQLLIMILLNSFLRKECQVYHNVAEV